VCCAHQKPRVFINTLFEFAKNVTIIGLFSKVSILLQMIKSKLENVLWYPGKMIKN
jgi:hypothetical protein